MFRFCFQVQYPFIIIVFIIVVIIGAVPVRRQEDFHTHRRRQRHHTNVTAMSIHMSVHIHMSKHMRVYPRVCRAVASHQHTHAAPRQNCFLIHETSHHACLGPTDAIYMTGTRRCGSCSAPPTTIARSLPPAAGMCLACGMFPDTSDMHMLRVSTCACMRACVRTCVHACFWRVGVT